MTGETKVCRVCGEEKELNEFSKAKSNKDGYNKTCKVCLHEYHKEYYVNKSKNKIVIYNSDITSKICHKCGEEKELSAFSKAKLNKDGYNNTCKVCKAKEGKLYYDNVMQKNLVKNNLDYKICIQCGEKKHIDEFRECKRIKDGYENKCKKCVYEYNKTRLENNPEINIKAKELRKENSIERKSLKTIKTPEEIKDHKKEYQKQWAEQNKERLKEKRKKNHEENGDAIRLADRERHKNNPEAKRKSDKKYYDKNKEILKIKAKVYVQNNKEKTAKYKKGWAEKNKIILDKKRKNYRNKNREMLNKKYLDRINSDPLLYLKAKMRKNILKAFRERGYEKKNKTVEILGCSFEFFKLYLESKFEPWMNWENRGLYKSDTLNYGWDLDHVVPLITAKTEEDIIRLNHYTNLRPLCSYINRVVKRDKILI